MEAIKIEFELSPCDYKGTDMWCVMRHRFDSLGQEVKRVGDFVKGMETARALAKTFRAGDSEAAPDSAIYVACEYFKSKADILRRMESILTAKRFRRATAPGTWEDKVGRRIVVINLGNLEWSMYHVKVSTNLVKAAYSFSVTGKLPQPETKKILKAYGKGDISLDKNLK